MSEKLDDLVQKFKPDDLVEVVASESLKGWPKRKVVIGKPGKVVGQASANSTVFKVRVSDLDESTLANSGLDYSSKDKTVLLYDYELKFAGDVIE